MGILVTSAGCDHVFGVRPVAAEVDAAPSRPPPMYVTSSVAHGGNVSSLMFPVVVPDVADRFLIVSVGLSGDPGTVPVVGAVTYGGVPLALLASVIGVPTQANTRSEQWQLVAPPLGNHDVVVTLLQPGLTIHASAMLFSGVNQTTPVRAAAKGSGQASSTLVTVASADGDLVESVVGHGGGITSAGENQVTVFVDNTSANYSLDNAGGSVAAGAAPYVTMTWTMPVVDEWQQIAASLQP